MTKQINDIRSEYPVKRIKKLMLEHDYLVDWVNETVYPGWFNEYPQAKYMIKDLRFPRSKPYLCGLSELREICDRIIKTKIREVKQC